MPRTRRISFSKTLGLAAAAVLACGAAVAADSSPASFLGHAAPAFSLPDTSGQTHALGDLHGEAGTVIIWVSTRCPVSNAYNQRMAALAAKFEPKGFKFVGINSNQAETPEEIAKHAKEHGLNFVILKDQGNRVADEYGASVTPEVFVLDAKGIVKYHGRIDDNMKPEAVTTHDLDQVLAAMEAGKEPQKAESKAFGCSIKRVAKAGA